MANAGVGQLPAQAGQDGLAGIQFTRRQFERDLADGMTVLTHHDDRVAVEKGHDAHRAGVVHEFAGGELAVG